MATKKRRKASGYTVGTRRIRRRKLNGARRSTRRRMNGANGYEAAAKTALKIAVGALAGGVAIGMAEKLVPNFYVRAGGAAVLGLVLAKMAPKMREVGIGVTVAGVVAAGHRGLSQANLLPAASLNGGKRNLTAEQLRALTNKLREAGRLNASNGTLNGDGRQIITSAERMFG